MLFSSRNHAIGSAHFQIAGGVKSLLILLLGYLCIIGLILGAVIYNTPLQADRHRALQAVTTLFLIIEGFGIVVMGAMRVAGSIRLDLTTNMIESHRQMPVSAAQAIFDYLTGTTVHVAAVILFHVIVLASLVGALGLNVESFVLSQVVLVAFALFIWCFSAMGALMFRQAVPIIVLFFILGSCGSMFLHGWGLLPGFSLLTAPFLGETIFSLAGMGGRGGGGGVGTGLHQAYPAALVAQFALGVLCFIGACRRYRGSYLTTFNLPMGWALLATWGVLSAFAITLWPNLSSGFGPRDFGAQPSAEQQIVAALCVAGLLLIIPAHALATWENRHGLSAPRRAAALAVAVLCAVTVLPASTFHPALWLASLLVLAIHAITVFAGLRLFSRFTPMTTGIAMFLLLGSLWILPLLAESIRWYFLPPNDQGNFIFDFTFIGALSPVGNLLAGWTQWPDTAPEIWIGLVFQAAVAAALMVLAYRPRKIAPSAPSPTAPSPITAPPPQSAPPSDAPAPG